MQRHLIFSQLSTIKYEPSLAGGIAQLVERQLCKLEVRGSNPLASSPEYFRGCRAEALAKADLSNLETFTRRATTRQPASKRFVARSSLGVFFDPFIAYSATHFLVM